MLTSRALFVAVVGLSGREGEMEGGREGGSEGGRKEGKEGGKEGGREGGREGGGAWAERHYVGEG